MSNALAVCVPVAGVPSETFIRRHVERLRPGGTVVIARRAADADPAGWQCDVPTLWLDDLGDEWGGERERAAVRRFLALHDVTAVLAEYLDIWLPFLGEFDDAGMQCVARAHGYDVSMRLREPYWRDEYLAYATSATVATMSRHSYDRLLAIGLPAERLAVVHCGIDLPAQPTRPIGGPVRVLATGRLVAKKHPVATIEACALAARQGADVRLTLVGDGPLMADVRAAATTNEVRIEVLGAIPNDDVLALMRNSDIFAQHSVVDPVTGDEEGLPVAILEAMAHVLPVVSTRHAGIPEAVVDGATGYLVDEGDIETMARRIRDLSLDPSLRERLGAAGRSRVAQRFTWDAERDALLALLSRSR